MKVSDYCSVGSSSAAKGFKKDASTMSAIVKRQSKRRDIEDINNFMATLAAICPEYYGEKAQ